MHFSISRNVLYCFLFSGNSRTLHMKVTMNSEVNTLPNYCHIGICAFENFEHKLFLSKSVNTDTALSGVLLRVVLRIKSFIKQTVEHPFLKKKIGVQCQMVMAELFLSGAFLLWLWLCVFLLKATCNGIVCCNL